MGMEGPGTRECASEPGLVNFVTALSGAVVFVPFEIVEKPVGKKA